MAPPTTSPLIYSQSINVPALGTSRKGDHIQFGFLCMPYVTWPTFSMSPHVVTCVRILFLFRAGQYSIVRAPILM